MAKRAIIDFLPISPFPTNAAAATKMNPKNNFILISNTFNFLVFFGVHFFGVLIFDELTRFNEISNYIAITCNLMKTYTY